MKRQEFFQKLQGKMSEQELLRISQAYWFAKQVHRNQKRDCGERYFEHCRRVACLLIDRGDTSAEEIIIALLHDCVEDGFVPEGVLKTLFGKEVENAIETLSKVKPTFGEDMGVIEKIRIEDGEYFHAISQSPTTVRRVKLADRLDNLTTMKKEWPKERQQKYVAETKTYVLLIAIATDEEFAERLQERCDSLGEPYEYVATCMKCKRSKTYFRIWMGKKVLKISDRFKTTIALENVDEMEEALIEHNWARVNELLREYGESDVFRMLEKHFCEICNDFYCSRCADIKIYHHDVNYICPRRGLH